MAAIEQPHERRHWVRGVQPGIDQQNPRLRGRCDRLGDRRRAGARLTRVVVEEVDHVPAAGVVSGIGQDGRARSRPVERHRHALADRRGRPVGHEDQPIGQVERLVDVVRDHDDGLAGLFPDPSRMSCSSKRVSESSIENGSSSSRKRGSIESARASDTHCCVPSDSAAGSWLGRVVDADEPKVVLRRLARARCRSVSADGREPHVLAAPSARAAGTAPGRRSRAPGPGPITCVPSMTTPPYVARFESGDDRQHRGLAAAGVAENRDELPRRDLRVDVRDGRERPGRRGKDLRQTGQFQRRACRHSLASSSVPLNRLGRGHLRAGAAPATPSTSRRRARARATPVRRARAAPRSAAAAASREWTRRASPAARRAPARCGRRAGSPPRRCS